VIEKRRRWVVRRKLDRWKIAEIAEALRVSEKTVDRWCNVYRKYGIELILGGTVTVCSRTRQQKFARIVRLEVVAA